MDYFDFIATQFRPRVLGMQNLLRINLIAAGVSANGITVEEVTTEGVNDMRFRITARRGAKTLTGYIELTASGFIDGQMALVVTLWLDGNGSQITTTYNGGGPIQYISEEGIDFLIGRIGVLEGLHTGEILTGARAFLNV